MVYLKGAPEFIAAMCDPVTGELFLHFIIVFRFLIVN